MESKDYQVLHYERIVNDDDSTSTTTAEVLEIVNDTPRRIFVVPVIGMNLPPPPTNKSLTVDKEK